MNEALLKEAEEVWDTYARLNGIENASDQTRQGFIYGYLRGRHGQLNLATIIKLQCGV